jgi:hypothetical protein
VIARILLWDLAESQTTLDELRTRLPPLPQGDVWISSDARERFGLISLSGALPDLRELVALIGEEPRVAEEFDVE